MRWPILLTSFSRAHIYIRDFLTVTIGAREIIRESQRSVEYVQEIDNLFAKPVGFSPTEFSRKRTLKFLSRFTRKMQQELTTDLQVIN